MESQNGNNSQVDVQQEFGAYKPYKPDEEIYQQVLLEKVIKFDKKDHMDVLAYCISKRMKLKEEQELIARTLKQMPLFQQNKQIFDNNKIIPIISKNVSVIKLTKRQVLFNYGSQGDKYYIVLQGNICILLPKQNDEEDKLQAKKQKIYLRRNSIKLSSLPLDQYFSIKYPTFKHVVSFKPGESFGEISLITSEKRTATTVSDGETILLSLSKKGFNNIMDGHKENNKQLQVQFLSNFQFFKYLGKASLMSLILDIKVLKLKCSEILYNIGDPLENVYFIKEGQVELHKNIHQEIEQQHPAEKQKFSNLNKVKLEKDKQKSNKLILVAVKGKDQYFGTEEFYKDMHKKQNLKRQYQVKCKSAFAEIHYVDYKVFLDTLRDRSTLKILLQELEQYKELESQRIEVYQQLQQQIKQEILNFPTKKSRKNSDDHILLSDHSDQSKQNITLFYQNDTKNEEIIQSPRSPRTPEGDETLELKEQFLNAEDDLENRLLFTKQIPCNIDFQIKKNFFKEMIERLKVKKQREKPEGLLNQEYTCFKQKYKNTQTYRLDLIKRGVKEKFKNWSLQGEERSALGLEKKIKYNFQSVSQEKKQYQNSLDIKKIAKNYLFRNKNSTHSTVDEYLNSSFKNSSFLDSSNTNSTFLQNNRQNMTYLNDYRKQDSINQVPYENGIYVKSQSLQQQNSNNYGDNLINTIGYSSILPEIVQSINQFKQNQIKRQNQAQQQQQQQTSFKFLYRQMFQNYPKDKQQKSLEYFSTVKRKKANHGQDFINELTKVKYQKGTTCRIPSSIHYFKQTCKAPKLPQKPRMKQVAQNQPAFFLGNQNLSALNQRLNSQEDQHPPLSNRNFGMKNQHVIFDQSSIFN